MERNDLGKDNVSPEDLKLAQDVIGTLKPRPPTPAETAADDYNEEAQSVEEYLQNKQNKGP